MMLRVVALLLLLWVVSGEGRSQRTSEIPVAMNSREYEMNRKVCMVCEQLLGQAVEYLKENKTQAEVMDIFHNTCLSLPSFRQQCLVLVDYYSPLFFLQVAVVSPHDFCRRVGLCDVLPPREQDNNLSGPRLCEFCRRINLKVLDKLKDPKTELSIVEGLEKGCIVADRFSKNCQNLIFQYVPLVLMGTVRILERANVCDKSHICVGNITDMAAPLIATAEFPLRDS